MKRLWFNDEILPNESKPQRGLYFHYPILFPCLYLPITVGIRKVEGCGAINIDYYFIILGLGLSYNVNWDI
jgi:hypothetical protein